MSTYRSPPASRPPTVVVMKQPLIGYLFLLLIFGFLSIFVVLFFSRITLTCARSEGRCTLIVERVPGLVFKEDTFALASLERASVESSVGKERQRLEGIALVRNGKAELLDGRSSVGHDGKVEWAATVNAFLRDPTRDRLEVSHGSVWPVYAWCLVGVAWVAAMLRTRTRFIIDKTEGFLTVEVRGLFVNSQAFPIQDIAAAEVHAQDSDGTTLRGIRLVFKDGTAKALTSNSSFTDGEKTRVVEAVNAALREEE